VDLDSTPHYANLKKKFNGEYSEVVKKINANQQE
jgi:hypothetical protein